MRSSILNNFLRLIIAISFIILVLLLISCTNTETINEKVSGELLTQINLKSEQIANPSSERLEIMKNMGMIVDNLENQRIFIHLERELNDAQVKELKNLGLTLYLDSWIPPVGAHVTGYIIADMPIEVLGELAEIEYITRLDTAEQQLQPQAGSLPKAE